MSGGSVRGSIVHAGNTKRHATPLPLQLGCFMAGVVVSSARSYEDVVLMNIRPLREVFSAVFFASIGLHVYPSFVYRQV